MTSGVAPRAVPRVGSAGERGQVAVLVLGVVVIAVTVVIGVVDVTAVQLARVRLLDVADAIALDAADAVAEDALYRSGMSGTVRVSDATVRASAESLLAASPRPDHISQWVLGAGTGTSDGGSATVELSGVVRIPWFNGLVDAVNGPVTVTVISRAQARVRFRQP
ncbi:MAG TPA: hypothetical protein VES01_07600 [Dermatophilaceae bacterium]|nr:hypothetical protein [Dermatophilaceae bacterium]